MRPELILASGNRGKRAELARMLAGLAFELRAPQDFALCELAIDETGASFAENARLKARAYAAAAGIPALADDSGLCVTALAGAPGLHSARFGGAGLDDVARRRLLLERLADFGAGADRRAEFRCVVCLAAPDGELLCEGEGACIGHIATADLPGPHGFGYDPLFIPAEHTRSFAQLSDDIKDRISHRGRALAALRPQLARLLVGT